MLTQSEFEVCELQFGKEVVESHNVKLEEEVRMWKEKYIACLQLLGSVENAYSTSCHAFHSMIHLNSVLQHKQFGVSSILNNDEKTQFYTGIPTYNTFQKLFTLLKPSTGESTDLIDERH